MLFNSLEFLAFFPIVVALYFATPYRYRWALLLAASYYFYAAWKAEYLVLLIATTLVDYWAGLAMGRHSTREGRRPYLIASLSANIGVLFAFKYFNFFSDSARSLFTQFNILYDVPAFHLLLPVGISFYTFQSMSYAIDVYRGHQNPERHLGIFALYVSFFPQLVAGPIERSTHLIPQFRLKHDFRYENVTNGLKLMLWGFFKKVVIADRLALYVNEVYNQPQSYSGAAIALATYFFAFQIFCDFSGYTDIARGSALVMNYDLMENFRRPYFARSIRDFWSRWHISLTTWFRDYLYVPLGGNRVPRNRWYANLFVVFLVSGLWHGARWTFVIWGALHGVYLIISLITAERRARAWQWMTDNVALVRAKPQRLEGMRRFVAVLVTFHLVTIAWIFFRANSMADVGVIASRILSWNTGGPPITDIVLGKTGLAISLLAIGLMELVHLLTRRDGLLGLINKQPVWLRWSAYYAVFFLILLFGTFGEQEFIYFQF